MTKAELVELLVSDNTTGFDSRAAAERAVDAVLAAIRAGVVRDREVQILGFGTFSVRERKARTGRHPQTGQAIPIAASRTVGFKPSKQLKDLV